MMPTKIEPDIRSVYTFCNISLATWSFVPGSTLQDNKNQTLKKAHKHTSIFSF